MGGGTWVIQAEHTGILTKNGWGVGGGGTWVIRAEHTGILTKNPIYIGFFIFFHQNPEPR